MKKIVTPKTEWFPLLVTIGVWIAAIILYRYLPEQVPIHWNASGQIDQYSSKFFATLFFPSVITGLYLIFVLIPWLEPRRLNLEKFANIYHLFKDIFVAFMAYIFAITNWAALNPQIKISTTIPLAMGTLFIILGKYLPQVKPNWFIGIRTPWTLSSDRVWKKTHQAGGWVFGAMGIVMIASILWPAPWNFGISTAVILFGALFLTLYSLFLYKQEKAK